MKNKIKIEEINFEKWSKREIEYKKKFEKMKETNEYNKEFNKNLDLLEKIKKLKKEEIEYIDFECIRYAEIFHEQFYQDNMKILEIAKDELCRKLLLE
jgi:hypothetical protein